MPTPSTKLALICVLLQMASKNLTNFPEDQSNSRQEAVSEEDEVILSLPRERGWLIHSFYLFEGFWCESTHIQAIKSCQKHFQAKDSDVVVASMPKSGTTWLKALTFSIVNRHHFSSLENHPLLTFNPHELVPFLDINVHGNRNLRIHVHGDRNPRIHVSDITEPRLFGTHTPFPSLAKSIKESNCRIIYICRNPFDTFVSTWIFFNKIRQNESLPALTIEEAFESYCKGTSPSGPFWDHMLGYLKESRARPHKVLFLKYEDLKEDANFHVKRIAAFLGCPFTPQEESNRVIENIVELCGFEKMKELEANKSGIVLQFVDKRHFFRKAEIGDWVNYLSPSMVEKLSKIMEDKFNGSDLSFRVFP